MIFYPTAFLVLFGKKIHQKGFKAKNNLKVALIGSYTLYPLNDFLNLCLFTQDVECEIWTGEYDNYIQEMIDPSSNLHQFAPDILVIQPNRERFLGTVIPEDSLEEIKKKIDGEVEALISMTNSLPTGWNKVIFNLPLFLDKDFDLLAHKPLGQK